MRVLVSAGAGDAPWLTPGSHASRDAAAWLVELEAAGLAPVVDFDGLPRCFMPHGAAWWVVRNRAAELFASKMTVMTGVAWPRPIQLRQPRGRVRGDRRRDVEVTRRKGPMDQ